MTITEDVLQLIQGCERHDHAPEVINITRSTARKLCDEMYPLDLTKSLQENARQVTEAYRKLTQGGSQLFGVEVVVHPDQPAMWVHPSENPSEGEP